MGITSTNKTLFFQRLFGVVLLVAILVSIMGLRKSLVAEHLMRGDRISILLFGIDAADASKHTDTLLVAVFDPIRNLLQILSVPRDTRVHLPGYRFRRINEIYGYHIRKGLDRTEAALEVAKGVEYLLSEEDAPINLPYIVQIDYSGFKKMVDLLGGIWVTVKIPMHYDDNAGNYHIHMEPGRYLMNGNEALHYVRFRGSTGDRGRILRQQEFVRNMARRFANPVNVFRFPKMVAAGVASVHTNLGFWDLVYLAVESRHLRPGRLGFYILPGRPQGPYWTMKKDSARMLARALILGEQVVEQRLEPIVPQMDKITISVWNASGKGGMAYQLTRYLRAQGFDVVDWGNYPINQVPTRVIDRTGKIMNAQTVAAELGIETWHSEPNVKALADVEVIIGKNFRGIGLNNE